jgi:2-polyprenyl-3-methyl-5-hydroxy-6-metoxy-1,4-benzoquinol methylase
MSEAHVPGQPAATPFPKHLPYEVDPTKDRNHFYENYWKKVALDLLLKHCRPAGQSVLDYGCGRGETLQIFRQAGFQVQGTDVDAECVRLSSRFGPATVLQSDRVIEQFGRKSVDIVTCFHVLEHVECPRKTLSELGALARSYLVLAVPNLRRLHGLFVREVKRDVLNEGHLQSWDHWHFLNLAERFCDLELVEWGFDATILPGVSHLAEKLFGQAAAIRLETGLFRRLFPLHGISVLGLFRPK